MNLYLILLLEIVVYVNNIAYVNVEIYNVEQSQISVDINQRWTTSKNGNNVMNVTIFKLKRAKKYF